MIIKPLPQKFFAEPDDNNIATFPPVGTEAEDLPEEKEEVEEEEQVEEEEETEPKEKATPAPFDAKALGAEFGSALRDVLKPTQQQQAPPLSKEEVNKLLNKWEPTDEWMLKFDNLETRKAAMVELIENVTKHADTLAQVRLARQRQEVEQFHKETYEPILTQYQAEQVEKRFDRFGKTYPQLSDPKLRPVLEAVGSKLSGKTFSSEQQFFTEVAKGVAAVIQTQNPDFKLTKSAGKPRSSNSLPTSSPGAGGGGGTGGSGASGGAGQPNAMRFFPKIKT